MRKTISLFLATQTCVLIAAASFLFSGCIIVHPDDEIIVERKTTSTVEQPAPSPAPDPAPSTPSTPYLLQKSFSKVKSNRMGIL